MKNTDNQPQDDNGAQPLSEQPAAPDAESAPRPTNAHPVDDQARGNGGTIQDCY